MAGPTGRIRVRDGCHARHRLHDLQRVARHERTRELGLFAVYANAPSYWHGALATAALDRGSDGSHAARAT